MKNSSCFKFALVQGFLYSFQIASTDLSDSHSFPQLPPPQLK